MNAPQTTLLTYSNVRNRLRTHMLRQTEIPVEHAVSLPLPTTRWLGPGYAFFASPALRQPGQPVEQGAPDRWWVVDAYGGRLIAYTLWKALPYADGVQWTTVQLPPPAVSLDELRQALVNIERLMEALVPTFFAGEVGEAGARKALAEALKVHLPAPLLPQYRAWRPTSLPGWRRSATSRQSS